MGKDTQRKILGGALFLASFIPGVGAITYIGMELAAILRFGGYAIASYRKKGKVENQEGTQVSGASASRSLPVIYGKAKLGVSFADIRVDEASDNDEDLWVVGAICHGGRRTGVSGGINNILNVWFDNQVVVVDGAVQGGFSSYLDYYERLGTDAQDVVAQINAQFATAWPATSKGRQIAYITLRLIYNRDYYPNDLPNIVVEIEGNKVYDTRDSQWKYSTNPALCIRDYILATVYGAGIAEAALDDASFQAAANYCDEMVSVPDGVGGFTTQKRFECNGALDTANSTENNLDELLTSCRGKIIHQGGTYRLFIPQVTAAETFELNADNIVGDWEVFSGGIDYAANILRGSYIDIDQDYRPNQVQFPEAGAANNYLTADNDFESARDVELPMTTDEYMAQQICQVILNESRQDITAVVTVKEEALKLEVGAVVKVTHATPGWDEKTFWVEGLFLGMDDQLRVVLREYDASAYSYTTMSDKDTVPNTTLPNPFSVADPSNLVLLSDATTALTGGSGQLNPRVKVTWDRSTHTFLAYEEVFARVSGGAEYQSIGQADVRDTKEKYVAEVEAGETWQIAVQAVSTIGVRSDLVVDTVVIPDPTEIGHVNDPPDAPSVLVLTATIQELQVLS